MDLGVVGRAVVNADVLDLHALEIELAGRPGILVTTAGAAMIEGGDDHAVLPLFLDDAAGDLRRESDGVVPGGRRHGAVTVDQRFRQAVRLRARDLGGGFPGIRAPRADPRPAFTSQAGSGMMTR